MRWLDLDWDEGPEKGGPFAPYLQSERGHHYRDALRRLVDGGFTYQCYCTNDEVEARRKAAGSKVMGYDGFCRELTDEQVNGFVGRPVGHPVPDARRRDRLGRPGARPDQLPDRVRARLRAGARQRGARSTRWSTRSTTRSWRSPTSCAVRTCCRARPDRSRCTPRSAEVGIGSGSTPAVRPPALRDGRGQQEAVQAGPRRPTCSATATTGSCPRGCSTTWPCWAGRSRRTATCSRWPRWSRPSTSPT